MAGVFGVRGARAGREAHYFPQVGEWGENAGKIR